jgi:hypothetical protein
MGGNLIRRTLVSTTSIVMKVIVYKFEINMVNTNLPLFADVISTQRNSI